MRHIRQGDSAFEIKSSMPSKWGQPTGVTVTITRATGAELVAATAATIYTGDTTSAAITAGSKQCVLTTGNSLSGGDIVDIGSDAYGYLEMIVESYNAGTQTVTFGDRFPSALPSGVDINGREMSYSVDASVDAFDFIGEVSVVWTPAGIEELPFTELFTVLKRESASGALASEFAVQFEDYWRHCENNFEMFERTARRQIGRHFKTLNRDLARIIDSDEYDYLTMLKIAMNIASTHGTEFVDRYGMLKEQYDTEFSILSSSDQWDDTNQDLISDESEVNQASMIGYRRGY